MPTLNEPENSPADVNQRHHLELQLLPSSNILCATNLNLSIGSSSQNEASGSRENEELKLAVGEMSVAEEARKEAKRQIELAELEFANAKRIRQQAKAELDKAQIIQEEATKRISSTILEITCYACKQQFQTRKVNVTSSADEASLAMSYMSSAD